MSSKSVAGTKTKNVDLKSCIPVPKKSKIPVFAKNISSKNKSDAVSLEKKPSFLPSNQQALPKEKCSIPKFPDKPSAQLTKPKNPQNKTVNKSDLVFTNKVPVKSQLPNGRLDDQRKIAKQTSNSQIVPKVKNTLIKNNAVKQTASNVTSGSVKQNNRLLLNSTSNKYGLKKAVVKEPPRQQQIVNTKSNKLKKSQPNKLNVPAESKKVEVETHIKQKNDDSNERPNFNENEPNAATEKRLEKKKVNYFALQKDIKFEADEFCRNEILSGRELSPSVSKLPPGFKLSFLNGKRSSIYHQEYPVAADPIKEALRAIENLSLSIKKDRPSVIKSETKVHHSPFKDRNSFYTPCSNPITEAERSLEAFKLELLQKKASKSAKKVSFNLNVQEDTPKHSLDIQLTPFKTAESRLTQINEKSEENTPNSPENKVNGAPLMKQEQINQPAAASGRNENISLELRTSDNSPKHDDVENTNTNLNEFSSSLTPMSKSAPYSTNIHLNSVAIDSKTETEDISADAACGLKHFDSEYVGKFCESSNTDDTRRMSFKITSSDNETQLSARVCKAKVCTPQPISLFTKSGISDISSPEFLADSVKNMFLSDCAPIQTPLFLRSLAKCAVLSPILDLSPVRIKLNFTDEKESPKKEAPTKSFSSINFENIATAQKILDDLADEECHLHLLNENMPVLSGRYLQNPISLILTEGDDMHFLPIKF